MMKQYILIMLNIIIGVMYQDALAAPLPKQGASLPIEITADSLSVDQNESTAVFTGKVEAVQGKVHLRSDKMTVYYSDDNTKPDERKAQAEGGASPSSISKIVVTGNVFITTPAETARGNEGVYNVDKKVIHLNGAVVLTQGENIVKGDKLVYNMATGKSIISTSDAKKAEGKTDNAPKGGRVKGVFVPQKDK